MVALWGLWLAPPPGAQAADSPVIAERRDVPLALLRLEATHDMVLTLAYFGGGRWHPEAIVAAMGPVSAILAQCGVAIARVELVRIDAPERFRHFFTPVSRELARSLALGKPAVYFVDGTRQRPAFDAEAIGRGNSRARPELADTVWIVPEARDLPIVIAHELSHVLMNSGEHSEESGNLMRNETAPENTRLTAAQCDRLRETGRASGLLLPH